MILINTATLVLHQFPDSYQRYAILSHTWGPGGEEVTYQEMAASERSETTLAKPGYMKIFKTCEIARTKYDMPYAWIDTCCIDKSSSAELSEAINSMFRWYKDAQICLAYLSDVTDSETLFQQSRWFSRGWTLQELIAPKHLVFFGREWDFRGTKGTMSTHISKITGIPDQILDHSVELSEIPVAQRLSWASTRETTRVEDRAYSLLGIFDINMAMLYGEGSKAFIRLQEQIIAQSADMSIFLWSNHQTNQDYTGLLAPSPTCFREMRQVVVEPTFTQREYYLTNRGVRLKLGLAWDAETGLAILPVKHSLGWTGEPAGIYLRRVGLDLFVRARPQECPTVKTERVYTVFTAVKSLTNAQSRATTNNVIKVLTAREIPVMRVEPHGSWDPTGQVLHASHTGTFLGYMMFEKQDYLPFAVVFCFRAGEWWTTVVKGDRWPSIQASFYRYYKENFIDLELNDDARRDREITYILGPNKMKAISVSMRGGYSSDLPSVTIRTVDAKGVEFRGSH